MAKPVKSGRGISLGWSVTSIVKECHNVHLNLTGMASKYRITKYHLGYVMRYYSIPNNPEFFKK